MASGRRIDIRGSSVTLPTRCFMKSKRTLLILTIIVILAAAGWFFANRSPGPLLIQCGPILTRPQVLAPLAPHYVALILAPDGTVWGLGDRRARGLLGRVDGDESWRSVRRLEVGSNWITLTCGSGYGAG